MPNLTRSRGFTLIEILVVLGIVGIVVAMVVVKILPDDKQALREEASRLALLLEHARDEALISGRSVAWSAQGETHSFWQREKILAAQNTVERKWLPLTGKEVLRERRFAHAVTLAQLSINRIPVDLDERLIFSPAGLNAPFAAVLDLPPHRITLSADASGNIRLHESP